MNLWHILYRVIPISNRPVNFCLSDTRIRPIRSTGADIRHLLLSKPPKPGTRGTQTSTGIEHGVARYRISMMARKRPPTISEEMTQRRDELKWISQSIVLSKTDEILRCENNEERQQEHTWSQQSESKNTSYSNIFKRPLFEWMLHGHHR